MVLKTEPTKAIRDNWQGAKLSFAERHSCERCLNRPIDFAKTRRRTPELSESCCNAVYSGGTSPFVKNNCPNFLDMRDHLND